MLATVEDAEALRQNPLLFLELNRIGEEEICVDCLRILVDPDYESLFKLSILGFLRENCVEFLNSTYLIESVLSCFLDQLIRNPTYPLRLLVPTLNTTTTICIALRERIKPDVVALDNGMVKVIDYEESLIHMLIEFLTGRYRINLLIQSCLLQCLLELERSCPCILGKYVSIFYKQFKDDQGMNGQLWKLLTTLCIRNITIYATINTKITQKSISSVILRGSAFPTPPSFTKNVPCHSFFLNFSTAKIFRRSNVDVQSLCRQCIEYLFISEPVVQLHTLCYLVGIKKLYSESSEMLFSILANELGKRDNLSLAAATVTILRQCKLSRGDQETRDLARYFGGGSLHIQKPFNSCIFWLKYLEFLCTTESINVPLKFLQPRTMDPNMLVFEKLRIYATNYKNRISACNKEDQPLILLTPLNIFQRQVYRGIRGYTAQALFRSIFVVYINHPSIEDSIYDYILALNLKHSALSKLTSSILKSIMKFQPDSELPRKSLINFASYISHQPLQLVAPKLNDYLPLMALVASQPTEQLPPFINLIERVLLESSVCSEGSWKIGEGILAIVRSIMQYQPDRLYFEETVSLLEFMSENFKNSMIKDSSAFLLTLSLSVSAERVKQYFTNLPKYRAEVRSYFEGLLMPIDDMKQGESVLPNVIKFDSTAFVCHKVPAALENEETFNSYEIYETAEAYLTCPKESKVCLCLVLKLGEDLIGREIDAIELTLGESVLYEGSPKMFIDYMSADVEEALSVELTVSDTLPASMPLNAVFIDDQQQTCMCRLDDIQLNFQDYFLPLPCQNRHAMFHLLWRHFKCDINNSTANHVDSLYDFSYSKTFSGLTLDCQSLFPRSCVQADDAKREIHIGIFIPPNQHLLFNVSHHDDFVVFHCILTDHVLIKMLFDYLLEIEKILHT